jgi:hypothetical protein
MHLVKTKNVYDEWQGEARYIDAFDSETVLLAEDEEGAGYLTGSKKASSR